MIRFIIERGPSREVVLKALNGSDVVTHEEIVSAYACDCPLGYGDDRRPRCEALAAILLVMSLRREELACRMAEAFATAVIAHATADRWTISSADVTEWLLDYINDPGAFGLPPLPFVETRDGRAWHVGNN